MLATRWEPWSELNRLSREMDRLFGRGGNIANSMSGVVTFPAMNVWADNDNLYAEAELPGFVLDDLEIYVTGNQLTIKGERRPPEQEGGTWHRQERGYGKFSRMIELPGDINSDAVSAEFTNGVLRVTLPKSEAVKPRRINVNAS
ncbi:Hsp20/alpha crystallin family protein [Aporhodopirellula aestuarii]|uniref:Hsp20/alpha crystallin family protein n=1 Tax=Aporhodopirellula aestuarii TaxID=2950107 RepID=A0ABT0U9Y0_9BACT|nr:Hsp20/alpha crystallin family protein [Aporhodopirellula aestuarii]MCM2373681.1 Hsp20/alpha crystallin family protein [Aporhodopirellula aestuarii]